MPLVYGSTLDRVGTIKGTVQFSSNYDCKGRDIQIIYEAWVESHWTTIEHKKPIHHHSRDVFGYQTWSFPLIHTKHNGSTVVAGVYEKEFEAILAHPMKDLYQVRKSVDSADSTFNTSSMHTAQSSPSRTSSSSSFSGLRSRLGRHAAPSGSASNPGSLLSLSISSPAARSILIGEENGLEVNRVLPSTSYSPDVKIRYTIRAVLQRPFPSLSNVEASQEIWVINSMRDASTATRFASSQGQQEPQQLHMLLPLQLKTPLPRPSTNLHRRLPPRPSASRSTSDVLINSLTPMPPTPYGAQQFVAFLCYFCAFVLGFGLCKRYVPFKTSRPA
ncbi:hypothetical protein BX616_007813 [Lobosporangium transversale]|nr:hypothetical protein BX616_007813 [Lobosporangium transversale]